MDRPMVALWDKNYRVEMDKWVRWHVENSDIDSLEDFMRGFMRFTRGTINPQTIKDVWREWDESKRRTEAASELVEGSMQGNQQGDS